VSINNLNLGKNRVSKIKQAHLKENERLWKDLGQVFDKDFRTGTHGTSVKNAKSILDEGLYSGRPDYAFTITGLKHVHIMGRCRCEKDIYNRYLDHVSPTYWAVVVIMIPRELNQSPWRTAKPKKCEMGERGHKGRVVSLNHLLPAKYIRGYIDVKNREFVPNPKFEENPVILPKPARSE